MTAPAADSPMYQVLQLLQAKVEPAYNIWQIPSLGSYVYTALAVFGVALVASASRIGGGALYVPVLVLCANIAPYEAVPLSKALIFVGSTVAFRHFRHKVDIHILKTITPAAMAGTLLGIFTNLHTPRAALVLIVGLALAYVSVKTFVHAGTALVGENARARRPLLSLLGHGGEGPAARLGFRDQFAARYLLDGALRAFRLRMPESPASESDDNADTRSIISEQPANSVKRRDLAVLSLAFIVVLASGAVQAFYPVGAMRAAALGSGVLAGIFLSLVSRSSCFVEPETTLPPVSFVAVGFFVGFSASCVGISGGILIAPFLIAMDIEPERALCTSAASVLLIAASSTFHFSFLGRVPVYYAVSLGVVAAIASLCGSFAIQWITRATRRRSASIFLLAVVCSASCVCILGESANFIRGDATQATSFHEFGAFAMQVFAAMAIKLVASVDDVLWLMPFLAPTRRKLKTTFCKLVMYIGVVQTIVLLTSLASLIGAPYLAHVNTGAILGLVSGLLLCFLTTFLFREWYDQLFDPEDPNDPAVQTDDVRHDKSLSAGRFALVSLAGQLDELAAFTTALLSGTVSPLALCVGSTLACIIVGSVSLGLLRFRMVATCILALPMWTIIGAVSLFTTIRGMRSLLSW